MKNEIEPLFLKCACSGHIFEIERFNDSQPGECYSDEGFNIALWVNSFNYKLRWSERFRWIWHIIKTGTPWSDSVILSNEQSKQIINYINKHLSKE